MMKTKISFMLLCTLIVALFGEHTLSFSDVHAAGIAANVLTIVHTSSSVFSSNNTNTGANGVCVPSDLCLAGADDPPVNGSVADVHVVTQSQFVQTIYNEVLALPKQSEHEICPMHLIAKYQLIFQHDTSLLLKANAQQGGCPTVTLGRDDVRNAATGPFWRLLKRITGAEEITSNGLTPNDLQKAYSLPSSTAGKGQTVAIVDAYNDPYAEADMNRYRSRFGLPLCTTRGGCFQKVDERGGTHYPHSDRGWAEEIALDLDMISAVCPNCHILLVEANDASFADLGSAVDTAVQLGAHIVSNSYGSLEDAQAVQSVAHYYNHPGVIITASSGDFGSYSGVQLPAAFNNVVAVGGTSLFPDASNPQNARGWRESAWDGTGSGCSKYINKPTWQKGEGCSKRTIPDVSAVADPETGVAFYNTHDSGNAWGVAGGTSASSAIIAGVYALAENAANTDGSYLYSHAANLYHVGGCTASAAPILATACKKEPGNDLAGLGTPNGISAF